MRSLSIVILLATVAAAQERPAYLGVGVEPVDAGLRRMLRVPDDVKGLMITALVTPSAASRAGLRLGDVIVSFDGKPLSTREALVAAIRAHKPGDAVAYEVRRGTGVIVGKLKLGVEEEGATMTHLSGPEPPPRDAPARPAPRGGAPELDRRLDKVQEDIAALRRRALARREAAERAAPDGLEAWLHREEVALEQARKQGAERRMAYHEARLALLREMRAAEVRLPTERVDRLERKLDEILALLRKREK